MTIKVLKLFVFPTLLFCAAVSAEENVQPVVTKGIVRDLLTAGISPDKPISRVQIQEITFPPKRKGPLHLHPIPVFTVIEEGAVTFQIEGEPARHFKAGDAFYEPANVRISRIDVEGETPAKLAVIYLLGKDDQELVRVLPKDVPVLPE